MTPMSWVISISAMPLVALQAAQQVEDLRLRRHIERGRGLVGDQNVGIAGQCHGDADALAKPAANWKG